MSEPIAVIDPHVHLWDLKSGLYPHFETPSTSFIGDNSPIARSYLLPEFLAEGGEAVRIEKVVHVEAFPTDALAETRALQALADAHAYPQGLVVNADLAAEDAAAALAAQAAFANVRGVRQVLNRHPDPRYSYGADDHLANPVWRRNFALLAHHGLSFDAQVYPHQMDALAGLAAERGDVAIILNHAGMVVDRHLEGWRTWKRGLRALAAQDNVSVKISGLGMFDRGWTVESFRPYVLEVLEAFGPGRAMFASNFPVDKLFSTYTALWQAFDAITADFTAEERAGLFQGNAQRLYRL